MRITTFNKNVYGIIKELRAPECIFNNPFTGKELYFFMEPGNDPIHEGTHFPEFNTLFKFKAIPEVLLWVEVTAETLYSGETWRELSIFMLYRHAWLPVIVYLPKEKGYYLNSNIKFYDDMGVNKLWNRVMKYLDDRDLYVAKANNFKQLMDPVNTQYLIH